jgi:DNA-directed RNA polymerase subunit RPC12/RpoP
MPKKSDTKIKKALYYKCAKCGDEIFWNTQKRMIYCQCGALGIDGCEYYVRLIGDEKDHKEIYKITNRIT